MEGRATASIGGSVERERREFLSLIDSLAWNLRGFFFFQGTLANRKIFKRVCFKTALLGGVSSSVWTLGYAITYHINQLFNKLGFRLGLNSMQG